MGRPEFNNTDNWYKTHCKHNHEFTEENTYRYPMTGYRQCKECRRASHARKRETED